MNATEQYIDILTNLKSGQLGLLRTHIGQGLNETVDGFDLFTGMWWPLRQKYERSPRREVAWLIAKLYAFASIQHTTGALFAQQLRRCAPYEKRSQERHQQRFDQLLQLSLDDIEPAMQWALNHLSTHHLQIDWVKLTDDLSIWERESTRLKWAEQYISLYERSL
jgi:CRISPR type I-E-associated protein CasB/Cse2